MLGALSPSIVRAQEAPVTLEVPVPAANLASVTPFIVGLKEPQGLLREGNNDILVCDYGAGEVLRFSATGEKKEVLATGLKGPSQIQMIDERIVVSERKANRVISLSSDKKVTQIGGEIIEPMGLFHGGSLLSRTNRVPLLGDAPITGSLFRTSLNGIYAVAHTTSKIYRLEQNNWKLIYEPSGEDAKEGRYGLRCLAGDGGTMFLSDEVNGEVLMVSPGGRIAKFASGFDDPSGLAVRGDWVYVCDEGNGGQLWKVSKDGAKSLVAEKLGRPRNVLFLDDKTALVSDRDGRVLKLNWAG